MSIFLLVNYLLAATKVHFLKI